MTGDTHQDALVFAVLLKVEIGKLRDRLRREGVWVSDEAVMAGVVTTGVLMSGDAIHRISEALEEVAKNRAQNPGAWAQSMAAIDDLEKKAKDVL